MWKSFYIASRKPDFTPQAFASRWRQHGRLGMSLPFWTHLFYVQADVIRPPPVGGASEQWDGVAYAIRPEGTSVSNPSPQDAADIAILLEDEKETFAGPIPPMMMPVREEILSAGRRGGITAFLFFRDADAGRAVAERFAGVSGTRRVIFNRVRTDVKASDTPRFDYTAIVEVSADTEDGVGSILGAEPAWRQADLSLVTREVVMWDRLPDGEGGDAPSA